jgi:hypothetical protein
MRTAIAATAGAAAALVASGALGVAAAEGPTSSSPPRTVSVQGVATVPLVQGASAATATATYRQAMAAAVADGQSKAEYLASKVGATLGPAQSVAEGGGNITCTGGGESGYAEYEGEQPDFGYAQTSVTPVVVGATRGAKAPLAQTVHRRRKRHGAPAAKAAAAGSCTLAAQVALVYVLG